MELAASALRLGEITTKTGVAVSRDKAAGVLAAVAHARRQLDQLQQQSEHRPTVN